MLSKVFLQPLFGEPYAWTQEYLDNIAQVKGFEWKIFSPHRLKVGKNTEVIKMDLRGFDDLLYKATGLEANNYIDGQAPHKNLTDYYPAYGHIFGDYIRDYDYWGHTNWDCVYGRLSHFLPDDELCRAKIWADESHEVNGTFSLYRNTPDVNMVYREVGGWEKAFTNHRLFGFDEVKFSQHAVDKGYVTTPKNYPFVSYDRFPHHVPSPNLEYNKGRLYEVFKDIVTDRVMGKEIMWFHFSYTKKWPL